MKRSLFFLLLVAAAGTGLAQHGKVAREIRSAHPDSTIDVIVQYRDGPKAKHMKKLADRGGKLKHELGLIRGAAFSVRAGVLADLDDDPDVVSVSMDYDVSATLDEANETVGASIAQQYGFNGEGVGIAVIDSGVYQHTDLGNASTGASRVVYSENFASDGTTADLYGHGTHVAGILAGNGAKSTGSDFNTTIRGVAPKANIVSLRVLDNKGKGSDSAVIAAVNRAIELKDRYNIRVINLSLGRPVYGSYKTDPLCQAVESAWRSGIVVVVAAGNSGRDNSRGTQGYATVSAPANDPYVITVGASKTSDSALRADDSVASYSSKGPSMFDFVVKPDIVAPGNQMVSLEAPNSDLAVSYPQNKLENAKFRKTLTSGVSSDYYLLSGTSMATPMVAGAAALLLEKQPNLTPDQVKARLMKTADKSLPATNIVTIPALGATYTLWYDVFTVGAGSLDVWSALNSSELPSGNAISPSLGYNPYTRRVYAALPQGSAWGTSVLWGTSVVWGTNVQVDANSVLWGTSVLWGSSLPQNFSVLWGTTTPASPEAFTTSLEGEH